VWAARRKRADDVGRAAARVVVTAPTGDRVRRRAGLSRSSRAELVESRCPPRRPRPRQAEPLRERLHDDVAATARSPGSPSDMLITSIPSATAASIAAASSGELPSSPTSASVGIVSAL
jgi:hypothetical protein